MPPPNPNLATELLRTRTRCPVCWEDFEAGNIVVYYETCEKAHPLHFQCHTSWTQTVIARNGKLSCHLCRVPWVRFHSIKLREKGEEPEGPSPSSILCEECGIIIKPGAVRHLDYEELVHIEENPDVQYRLVQKRVCSVCAMSKNF